MPGEWTQNQQSSTEQAMPTEFVQRRIASGDALYANQHHEAALVIYEKAASSASSDERVALLTKMIQVNLELQNTMRATILAREVLEYYLAGGRTDDLAAWFTSLSEWCPDEKFVGRMRSFAGRFGLSGDSNGTWLDSSSLRYNPLEDFSKLSVLLVEDDPSQMTLLVTALEPLGCTIYKAENGLDALKLVNAYHPSVVVSDLMLPRLTGSQLFEQIASGSTTASIPFVCLSSNTSEREVVAALNQGVEEYWFKPVRPLEFRARVRRLLRRLKEHSSLRGTLSEMSSGDLLQSFELNRRTGTLSIHSDTGSAAIYIVDGTPIDAMLGDKQGEAAFYQAVLWEKGSFEYSSRLPNRRRTIFAGTQALLMEAFRQIDEVRLHLDHISMKIASMDDLLNLPIESAPLPEGSWLEDVSRLRSILEESQSYEDAQAVLQNELGPSRLLASHFGFGSIDEKQDQGVAL